jgi:hypothetical protein
MLAQHPELQARVRNNTLRMKDVVSETMRFESPLADGQAKGSGSCNFWDANLKRGITS